MTRIATSPDVIVDGSTPQGRRRPVRFHTTAARWIGPTGPIPLAEQPRIERTGHLPRLVLVTR